MPDTTDQRRLVAIIAADVAGYTRLIEEDTDGTVAAWKAACTDIIEPEISNHSGRIVKLTGDGFLAEFPVVQNAVKCAIAMQNRLAENSLDFRMGINLGDIVDDGKDIHGEGVNVAARLEGLAEPGSIIISGGVHDQVMNRIDVEFEDLGEKKVKNIARPVKVYQIISDGKVIPTPVPADLQNSRRWTWYAATAAVMIAIASGLFIWQPWVARIEPASIDKLAFKLPEKPSIAVLPFDDLSTNNKQEFFADGITEDIITSLSKIPDMFVIARNSTFTYKGKPVKIQQVAEDLGVRFVLEGSVQRAGDQIRVTAQLIDALSGRHLWADSYDRDFKKIFALQDDITRNVVTALEVKLTAGD